MTLEDIKGRCHIDEITECWVWRGATSDKIGGSALIPRVYGPNFTRDPTGNTKTVQTGNRAVWHALTGKPIPAGYRVFKRVICTNSLCLNPDHLRCGTAKQWGQSMATKGTWKGQAARISANRAIGRSLSVITDEIAAEIRNSDETGLAISKRIGISESVISRTRNMKLKSEFVGNPFAGLMT